MREPDLRRFQAVRITLDDGRVGVFGGPALVELGDAGKVVGVALQAALDELAGLEAAARGELTEDEHRKMKNAAKRARRARKGKR